MTDELTPGWELATVGDVAHFVRGVTYSKEHAKKAPAPGLVGILRATNIGDGLNFDDLVFVPERFVSDEQIVRDGDVVLAMSSGSKSVVGKAAIARSPQRCGFGAFCGVIRPSQAITPSLLAHYFQTKAYRNAVSEVSKGSNINNLKAGHILERPLPIPPAGEQQRIASRIDELFSRIDEGERALKRVSLLVERYRQAVLKAAVTGELTRAWRQKNKDKLESGEGLLARILTARREAWETAELEKMKAKGITPTNDKWKQKYKEPSSPDTTNLPALPFGWLWTSLESLCPPEQNALKAGPFGSALKKSDYSKGGYKIYGQEQVIAGDWSIGDSFIGAPKYQQLESCKVQPCDILISLVGTIGKVLVLPADCAPGVINPRLIKVSLNLDTYAPLFLKAYFESSFLKSLYKHESHGATMDVLNMGIIQKLPFPLCGLEEQQEIVALCTHGFDKITRLKDAAALEERRSIAIRQSVLKSAFRGQLVGQDPADEPASSLLERIAAERGAQTAAPKRGRKKTSA